MEVVREIVARNKEIEAAAEAFADARKALAALSKTPDDPDANALAGKYLCRFKGEWERGLAMLMRGSDPTWKSLAERDRKGPTSPEEQARLGDDWWELSEAEKAEPTKRRLQLRAASWYLQALRS